MEAPEMQIEGAFLFVAVRYQPEIYSSNFHLFTPGNSRIARNSGRALQGHLSDKADYRSM